MLVIQENLRRTFIFSCISFGAYFTVIQLCTYAKNEDITAISYRKFNEEKQDTYPVFTVCLKGSRGKILKRKSAFWKPNVINPSSYVRFLRGNIPAEWKENYNWTQIHQIRFEDVMIDFFKDIIMTEKGFITFTRNRKRLFFGNCFNDENNACQRRLIVKSHQTPDMICFSRKFYYEKNVRFSYDRLKLNISALMDLKLSLHLYIHQDGQLIRSMRENDRTPVTLIRPIDLMNLADAHNHSFIQYFSYKISNVVKLRRRANGVEKCNDNLLDEDQRFRSVICELVGCVPSYWLSFNVTSSLLRNFGSCNPQQYQQINDMIKTENFDTISELYTYPCVEMTRSISSEVRTRPTNVAMNQPQIWLTFEYHGERYMEILNKRAFSTEMLVSSIGGYVGMY